MASIANAQQKEATVAEQFVRKLTETGKTIMQKYIKSRSIFWGRSTGRLARSIGIEVEYKGKEIEGTIEVGKNANIPYQRAQEYGIKKRTTISGNPIMAFKASAWRGAKIPPNKNGYYIFYSVRRGRFKGKYYVMDTAKDLKSLSAKLLKEYVIPGISKIYIRRFH